MATYESQRIRETEQKESPFSELLQMITAVSAMGEKRKEDVESSLAKLVELSNFSTNDTMITNVIDNWDNQKSKSGQFEDTRVYHDLIGNVLQDRKSQINTYGSAVEQVQDRMDRGGLDFLKRASEFEDLHNQVNLITNPDGTPKYESVMEWVSNEYADIDTLYNVISTGKNHGLRHGKGINDESVLTDITRYKNRLDATMEALISGDVVDADEARIIITGDRVTLKQMRQGKATQIGGAIEEVDSMLELLDKTIGGFRTSKTKDITNEFVSQISSFAASDDERKEMQDEFNAVAEGKGISLNTVSDIENIESDYLKSRAQLLDNYKYWWGTDYEGAFQPVSQIRKKEFEKYASGDFGIDEGDKELFEFEQLSPDEQKSYIEEKKKAGEKQYEIEEGIVDTETGEKFSSGERLIVDYTKGLVSMEDLKDIFSKAGIDWSANLNVIKGAKNINKRTFQDRFKLGSQIKLLNEWFDIDKDKAGLALNEFLKDEISLSSAASKGRTKRPVGRWQFKGKTTPGRTKSRQINAFKSKFEKFQDETGLSLEDFIKQNETEYRNIARLLKYAYYFKTRA